MKQFNQGITISIHEQRPSIITDQESGQQKVELTGENEIKMEKRIIGAIFIKTSEFHTMKTKKLAKKYSLFEN